MITSNYLGIDFQLPSVLKLQTLEELRYTVTVFGFLINHRDCPMSYKQFADLITSHYCTTNPKNQYCVDLLNYINDRPLLDKWVRIEKPQPTYRNRLARKKAKN